MKHQTEEPVSISKERPDAPPDLVAICNKMMAKSREVRYQTAAEVSHALTQWLLSRENYQGAASLAAAQRKNPRPDLAVRSSRVQPGERSPSVSDTASNLDRPTIKGSNSEEVLGGEPLLKKGPSGSSKPGGSSKESGSKKPKRLPVAKPLNPLDEFSIKIEDSQTNLGSGRIVRKSDSTIGRKEAWPGWFVISLTTIGIIVVLSLILLFIAYG